MDTFAEEAAAVREAAPEGTHVRIFPTIGTNMQDARDRAVRHVAAELGKPCRANSLIVQRIGGLDCLVVYVRPDARP